MIRDDVIRYLNQLRDDLETFNPDQVQIVKEYMPQTTLKMKLVDVLSTLRYSLIETEDEALTQTFTVIKGDLMDHITKRISRLQNPATSELIDPWLAVEIKTEDPSLKQQCRAASTHIDDLLFACNEVAERQLLQASSIEANEVQEFCKQALPSYFQLFVTPSPENLQQVITTGFKKLEEGLRREDFAKAKEATAQIKASLKSYAHTITALNQAK